MANHEGKVDTEDARKTCYHAIRHEFTSLMRAFFKLHPELLDDDPTIDVLLRLMQRIIKILDDYELRIGRIYQKHDQK